MAIKTSIGTPTANSYVSVASANEYLEARENNQAWVVDLTSTALGGTTAQRTTKENILIQATREIDHTHRYHSQKYNQGIIGQDTYQNLEFPRWENVDDDSNIYIPDEVKYATYEQALWIRERSGVKTTVDGLTIQRQLMSIDSYNYLKPWVNRQASKTGKQPWRKSAF
jgi:hypothetical protein